MSENSLVHSSPTKPARPMAFTNSGIDPHAIKRKLKHSQTDHQNHVPRHQPLVVKTSNQISSHSQITDVHKIGSVSSSSSTSRSNSPIARVRARSQSPRRGLRDIPISIEEQQRRVRKAKSARLYLLHRNGPAIFDVVGDSPLPKFRVTISSEPSCSCRGQFCCHLLFVYLRVFKLDENDARLFAKKLCNYEVETLLNKYERSTRRPIHHSLSDSNILQTLSSNLPKSISPDIASCCKQRKSDVADSDDLCPICLLEMVEGESLVVCQSGCHNKLHQHCMNVWNQECMTNGEALFCPLCRTLWGSESRCETPDSCEDIETGFSSLTIEDPEMQFLIQNFSADVIRSVLSNNRNLRDIALNCIYEHSQDTTALTDAAMRCFHALFRNRHLLDEFIHLLNHFKRYFVSEASFSILAHSQYTTMCFSVIISHVIYPQNQDKIFPSTTSILEISENVLSCEVMFVNIIVDELISMTAFSQAASSAINLLNKLLDVNSLVELFSSTSIEFNFKKLMAAVFGLLTIVPSTSKRIINNLMLQLCRQAVTCDHTYKQMRIQLEEYPMGGKFLMKLTSLYNDKEAEKRLRTVLKNKQVQPQIHSENQCRIETNNRRRHNAAASQNDNTSCSKTLQSLPSKAVLYTKHSNGFLKQKEVLKDEEDAAFAEALSASIAVQKPLIPELKEDIVVCQVGDSLAYLEDVHWRKGGVVGSGAYSTCFTAKDVNTGYVMVVKQISFIRNRNSEEDENISALLEEIKFMRQLKHSNIIQLYGGTLQDSHFNIFLEYMSGGSLSTHLRTFGALVDQQIKSFTKQILSALIYIHGEGIIHRDLKGANILLDSTSQIVKLGDFGTAIRLESVETMKDEFTGQMHGTVAFMAPEVIRQEHYGRRCDIWSLGCIIIEMSSAKLPWSEWEKTNNSSLMMKIALAKEPPAFPSSLSFGARDVALRCLELKPEDRPSARSLFMHSYLTT